MALSKDDLQALSELLDIKLQPIYKQLDKVNARLDQMDVRMNEMDAQLKRIDSSVTRNYALTLDFYGNQTEYSRHQLLYAYIYTITQTHVHTIAQKKKSCKIKEQDT
ncbi:MAG: hypothetical protein HFG96_05645 [Lachnospiraceae bacterium]|jgi:hypothetical protein|nr:hypothetical protein [Lachnospiraceae bacterium]